jgi:hypothetical protein
MLTARLDVGLLRDRACLGDLRRDPVMRRSSSSVTIGLLANPQTPLWITRTPKPAAPGRPPARAPPPRPAPPGRRAAAEPAAVSVAIAAAGRVHAGADAARETHVGMRAADLFASPSTMSASPLNRGAGRPRLREQLADQIARREQQAGGAKFQKVATWAYMFPHNREHAKQQRKRFLRFCDLCGYSQTAGEPEVM